MAGTNNKPAKFRPSSPVIPGRPVDLQAGANQPERDTYKLLRELERNKAEIGTIILTLPLQDQDALIYNGTLSQWENSQRYITTQPKSASRNLIQPAGNFRALALQPFAGQTVNQLEALGVTGNPVTRIQADGSLFLQHDSNAPVMTVRSKAGQTKNLIEFQTQTGFLTSFFDAAQQWWANALIVLGDTDSSTLALGGAGWTTLISSDGAAILDSRSGLNANSIGFQIDGNACAIARPTAGSQTPLTIAGITAQTERLIRCLGRSSTTADRRLTALDSVWADSTDATRKGRGILYASDFTPADRECLRWETSGTAAMLGFLGANAVVRPALYTQTFATTARTIPAYTTNAQNVAYTGAADGEAKLVDLNALRLAYENLRASYDETVKVLNAVIDDQQAYGLLA